MTSKRITIAAFVTFLVLLATAQGSQAQAIKTDTGTPTLDLRLRYEWADQAVPGRRTGSATTLRARLGYLTPNWNAWDLFGEFEGVWSLGDDDKYNSLLNGVTDRAVIADPDGEELNQVWLRYRGLAGSSLKIGRQRLILDNARFVGNVGWRQNEQTFDAISLENSHWPELKLHYVYTDSAQTILFSSREMQAHLLNVRYSPDSSNIAITGYAYLLDFDDNATLDSQTLGLRLSGQTAKLGYTLEYASQSDYADSSDAGVKPRADYYLLEVQGPIGPITGTLGYEVLQGDDHADTAPFSTPLATLHRFQGWADVFLTTPASGIADLYVGIGFPVGPTQTRLVYHDFAPDAAGPDHGEEYDLLVSFPIRGKLTGLIKYAHYEAQGFGVDTQRFWLQFDFQL